MSKRKTVAELESKIASLEAFQEAYYILDSRDYDGVCLTSGEASIEAIGLERAAGGIVRRINGEKCAPMYLSEYIAKNSHSVDPYVRDLASKAVKAQVAALASRERKLAAARAARA